MRGEGRVSNKRGQVTIFIIIAIAIVVLGILIFTFFPGLRSTFGFREENPNNFLQSCLTDRVQETAELVSSQGGSLNPENFVLFDNSKVEYLCYTNEYYLTCSVQQPLLKEHIENEFKDNLTEDVSFCLNEMNQNFKDAGYQVVLNQGEFDVELLPKRIEVHVNSSLSLTKGETVNYDSFTIPFNNNLYELVTIANSILEFESSIGDAETTTYMDYYKDLKVEKNKKSDGTTIYVLTDRNTEDKFQFASRSVAWPAGYA